MADANTKLVLVDLLPVMDRDLQLRVGVLEGATHTDAKGRSIPVAEYAMHNEYGTRRIPSRPFLRTSLDIYGEAWAAELSDLISEGVDPEDALERVGAMAQADIRRVIEEWATPPNKESTIRRKRSQRDNPLVDSGDLQDAIAYDVYGGIK